jgi:predicted dithiol-disulfide oxidoreductase (DUF899 family)
MTNHRTAIHEEWLAQLLELLKAEKELTRRSEELALRRQEQRMNVSLLQACAWREPSAPSLSGQGCF